MLVKDFECRSFEAAEKLLGGKQSRTVCNNTGLHRFRPSSISLCLYGHTIVEFGREGGVELWGRGWRTATTKDRMNKVLPVPWQVYQRRGKWYVRNYRTNVEQPFVDGMSIFVSETEQD